QFPVQRTAVLRDQERQARKHASRRRLPGPHTRFLERDERARRRIDLSPRRHPVLRQGPAAAGRTGVARRGASPLSSDQCAQHRTDGFLTMLLTPSEAKAVTDRLLARSKADHCIVRLDGGDRTNLRFARGSVTTNGNQSSLRVIVESHFGYRAGAASVGGLDE